MLRFFLSLIATSLALVVALPSAAAQPLPDLVVTVRDLGGAGVVGVTVQIRDDDDGAIVAQGETDATGSAVFATLAISAVRVVVQGRLADGTALQQPGQDAGGIAFYLGAASNRLDLRVEVDGAVLPDPQTMLAPDVGLNDRATTAAATQTSTPARSDPATPTAPLVPIDSNDTPIADMPVPFGWLIVVVLGGGLIAVLVLFVLPRRGA